MSNEFEKLVGKSMAIGEVLSTSQKEANDWKVRMLKAGFLDKGLSLPDDWDDLDEDEKTIRLKNIEAVLNG